MALLLIDGLNLIRRVHAGVPADALDHHEAVINACVASARRALRRHRPTHVILVMEDSGESWRAKEFPNYKKDRPPMPADLAQSLPAIQDCLAELGIKTLSEPGFEADDVIASIAARARDAGVAVVILSTDKSFCQIVGERISLFDHFNDVKRDTAWMAARLIKEYKDIDTLMQHAKDISGKLGEKIRDGADDIALARRLVALRLDVDLGANLHDFRWSSERLTDASQD
jgi:protein Xni